MMSKKIIQITTLAIASSILLVGCTNSGLEDIENSVSIIGEDGNTQQPQPGETQASGTNNDIGSSNQTPAKPIVPTKPSDYNYPEITTSDPFEMLAELAKNTAHSSTTLGALEKYTAVTQDGTVYNVTLAFNPTIGGNNLAVSYDYPEGYTQEDVVFSINQVADEKYRNTAEWLLGHQTISTANLKGKLAAEIKDGYIEVTIIDNDIVARYYHKDNVLVKLETIFPTGEPSTIRTIEYKKDGEVAELIAQVQ